MNSYNLAASPRVGIELLNKMSEKFTLSATKRTTGKTARREVREAGNVLAALYGYKVDPIAIAVNASAALRVYRKAGTSAVIDLTVEGKTYPVIIKAVTIHPVRHELAHIDFLSINVKEATTVSVPLEFIGESPAVKLGGTFLAKYHTIEVRCLPSDIPHSFQVDISSLKEMNDHLCVADLHIDEKKFEIMGIAPEIAICSVAGHAEKEEDTDAPQTAEVEVTGQKAEEDSE
jgi:large subunit ribosomal protein L25